MVGFEPKLFIEKEVEKAKQLLQNQKAMVAVSGGIDSTTAAIIAYRAIKDNLDVLFVDTGLMRENEQKRIQQNFEKFGIKLNVIDAKKEFLKALKNVTDPEKKRKIIGKLFIEIFQGYAKKNNIKFLIQGTIAPDWLESGGQGRKTIKSHHNVGGLPKKMWIKIYEPLRDCYKHEVRMIAKELGLDESFIQKQPFPGPGLAVRIIGPIDEEKIEIVKKATAIVENEIEKAIQENKINRPWQYFAVLLNSKATGVKGDERDYGYIISIRIVESIDGMTANYVKIPYEILEKISCRITNEIKGVNRVVYDITNKPPATIEYE